MSQHVCVVRRCECVYVCDFLYMRINCCSYFAYVFAFWVVLAILRVALTCVSIVFASQLQL